MASIFSKFFGRTVSEAAGVAAGIAVASPLRPVVQAVENETWKLHPDKPVPAPLAAAIVAEDVAARPWGEDQAASTGFSGDAFDKMLGEALSAPGLDTLYGLWRRGLIGDADFTHGLRKAKLEGRWDGSLVGAKDVLLTPAELANARQQGFVTDTRQVSEAALQGITSERAEIQFELAGLPPGAETAQQYLNRGLIDDATFAEMIREGHTKTKYTDVLRRGARYVLSPINYVEGRLRGWLTDAEMYAGTALHGVTQADTDLLFKIHGRPISFHQTFIGTRRGGSLDGPITGIDPAFLASLRRSNIQPSFYNLAWAQRYVYPSAFVLRALTQAGDISEARAEEVLLFEGWEPGFAKQVAAAWAGGGGTTADSHVSKAQTHLWTTTHASYKAEEIDSATATATLGTLGVSAAAIPQVLALWDAERALIRAQLSPSQVKKAVAEGVTNPATGAPWTFQDGVNALLARGYNVADATVLLQE